MLARLRSDRSPGTGEARSALRRVGENRGLLRRSTTARSPASTPSAPAARTPTTARSTASSSSPTTAASAASAGPTRTARASSPFRSPKTATTSPARGDWKSPRTNSSGEESGRSGGGERTTLVVDHMNGCHDLYSKSCFAPTHDAARRSRALHDLRTRRGTRHCPLRHTSDPPPRQQRASDQDGRFNDRRTAADWNMARRRNPERVIRADESVERRGGGCEAERLDLSVSRDAPPRAFGISFKNPDRTQQMKGERQTQSSRQDQRCRRRPKPVRCA